MPIGGGLVQQNNNNNDDENNKENDDEDNNNNNNPWGIECTLYFGGSVTHSHIILIQLDLGYPDTFVQTFSLGFRTSELVQISEGY